MFQSFVLSFFRSAYSGVNVQNLITLTSSLTRDGFLRALQRSPQGDTEKQVSLEKHKVCARPPAAVPSALSHSLRPAPASCFPYAGMLEADWVAVFIKCCHQAARLSVTFHF